MAEWQPIETAPKDEWVLIAAPDWPESGLGILSDSWADEVSKWKWQDAYSLLGEDEQPTHWMPKPLPPQAERSIEEQRSCDEAALSSKAPA